MHGKCFVIGLFCAEAFFSVGASEKDCQASCVSKCEEGWEEEGGKCYFFSQEHKTWVRAEEECKRDYESNLATVTDKQTGDLIKGKCKNGESIWIGARQTFESNKEGWSWADCSPWNYTSWREFYTPTSENAPFQECAFYDKPMSTIGTWRAGRCNYTAQQFRFVCSKPICKNNSITPLALASTGTSILLIILLIVLLIILLIGMVVITFKWRRREREGRKKFRVEKNDLYGLYYTAGGDRIDQGTVEIEDQNDYYAS